MIRPGRRLAHLVLALAAAAAGPAAACPPPSRACEIEKMKLFRVEDCLAECAEKLERLGKDPAACPELCEEALARRLQLVRLQCVDDKDADGIPSPNDRCPATPLFVPVDWRGCPDGDRDGVPDDEDRCPDTRRGAPVSVGGCETAPQCHEGHCGTAGPHCRTAAECDRLSEQPLPLELPRERIDAAILRTLSRQIHPLRCPDSDPPDQPRLITPAAGITQIAVGDAIGAVAVELVDGQVVAGPTLPIPVSWRPVEDDCGPVTYSVYLETYHCHELPGLLEPASYRNRGWCRWMPFLYRSLAETSLTIDFPIGKVLYEVHLAFADELGWDTHITGTYPIQYMPFWLRLRVLAHDGNGTTSPFGPHSDQRYLVLYADDTVPLALLSEIPIAP